jgi:hypothetical protein
MDPFETKRLAQELFGHMSKARHNLSVLSGIQDLMPSLNKLSDASEDMDLAIGDIKTRYAYEVHRLWQEARSNANDMLREMSPETVREVRKYFAEAYGEPFPTLLGILLNEIAEIA